MAVIPEIFSSIGLKTSLTKILFFIFAPKFLPKMKKIPVQFAFNSNPKTNPKSEFRVEPESVNNQN